MKDKVFENLEAILNGKRMKFLDPNRKALLKLHPSALTVWMAYWMFENDAQEAYPTMATLMDVTDMSENTIRKWRDYMVETGWMIKLTGSAALRYIKPTNGAWNISVYRVNDPTSEVDPSESEAPQKMTPQELTGQNMTVPELAPNGASTGTSAFTGTVAKAGTLAPPPPVTERSETLSLRESKPVPSEAKPAKQQPVIPPPITAPPPVLFHCPACDYTHRHGSYVAEHIEKEHPETGQQSFGITCPKDGCWFCIRWNKVSNNKAEREAELFDHLEVQHDPKSSRYAPWDACPQCGFNLPRCDMPNHLLKCKGARH